MAYRVKSLKNMQNLLSGVLRYRQEHGENWPRHLSDLYPDYIPDLRVFYLRGSGVTLFVPLDAETDPRLIDVFSPYSFVLIGGGEALVFERVPLGRHPSIGYAVASRSGEISTRRLPREEFAKRFPGRL